MIDKSKELYSISEVANLIGMHHNTVYLMKDKGIIPPEAIIRTGLNGKRFRIKGDWIREYLHLNLNGVNLHKVTATLIPKPKPIPKDIIGDILAENKDINKILKELY